MNDGEHLTVRSDIALYEEVRALRTQGLSHYAIADVLGLSRPTVRRFLEQNTFSNGAIPLDPHVRASSLPICPFCMNVGLLDVTMGANFFGKRKLVAMEAHERN